MSKLYDIRVRGGQHHDFDRAIDAHALFLGCQLHLKREPDNPFDPNAIAAYVKLDTNGQEEWKIGFVATNQASRYSWRMDQGAVVHLCTVTKLDKHGLTAALDLRGGWGERPSEPPPNQTMSDLDDDIPF